MEIVQIRSIDDLEQITGITFPEDEKKGLQEVIDKYPVRFTHHLAGLIKKSSGIKKQYLPDIRELEKYGTVAPFEEGLHTSENHGFERIYTDRAIITLNFICPSYCRFCFRKSRVLKSKTAMTLEDIDNAVEIVQKETDIKGVLITGGDPFLDPEKLLYLIENLIKIDHLTFIRIGTRSFLTQPENLTDDIANKLSEFIKPNPENPEKSKTLLVVTHINHPDEISPESVKAFNRFTKRGIPLRNQAVLLKGVNDDIKTLRRLFETLLANNVIPYYLFHCMPLEGMKYLRPSVQRGIDIFKELSKLSGLISPHFAIVTQIGKIRLIHTSKLKYKWINDEKFVVLKSPYKTKDFLKSTNQQKLPDNCHSDDEGYIIVDYLDGED